MTLSFDRWVRSEAESRDLDGYARERVEEELRADPTLEAVWRAGYAADDRQSTERRASWNDDVEEEATDVIHTLEEVRRKCDDALEALADRIVREAVDAEVHGHSVDLRHALRLDCPACSEGEVEAFHLGHRDAGDTLLDGWVCGYCGATVETDESGDVFDYVEGSA